MTFSVAGFFDRIASLVFGVLLLFIIFGIIAGVVHLFLQFGNLLMNADVTRHYVGIVADVLTLFVLIELSRSVVSHFSEHRLRLTFIVDAGIVFVLREIMLKLFEQKIPPEQVYALSALLLVLGCLRTASVLVYQREKWLIAKKRMQRLRQPPLDSFHKPGGSHASEVHA